MSTADRISAAMLRARAQRDVSPPPRAETFLKRWPTYSAPVAVRCDDGREYVIKGRQLAKAVVNEQVVARLGRTIGAPVLEPALVDVPAELIAIEPQMRHLAPGLAHGAPLVPDCSDRAWLEHTRLPMNRVRFAALAVLYAWAHAGDHQLIYSNLPPELVYSVDHGHFFPRGPNWGIADLAQPAPPAAPYRYIVEGCGLRGEEVDAALLTLLRVTEDQVVDAVAAPPEDWAATLAEREAAFDYLVRRRRELLSPILPVAP